MAREIVGWSDAEAAQDEGWTIESTYLAPSYDLPPLALVGKKGGPVQDDIAVVVTR